MRLSQSLVLAPGVAAVLWVIPVQAGAEDAIDLVGQQSKFGWRVVANIVRSLERSDISSAETQQVLERSGLGSLTMPVAVADAVQGRIQVEAPLSDCRWEWGVSCGLEVLVKTPVQEDWRVRCVGSSSEIEGIAMKAVSLETVQEDRLALQISGVLECWEGGGESLRLDLEVAAPPVGGRLELVEGLSLAAVDKGLVTISDAAVDCLSSRPQRDGARVFYAMEIDAQGAVSAVDLSAAQELSAAELKCLTAVLTTARFEPPASGKARVHLPLEVHRAEKK